MGLQILDPLELNYKFQGRVTWVADFDIIWLGLRIFVVA